MTSEQRSTPVTRARSRLAVLMQRFVSRLHIFLYRRTGGALGGRFGKNSVLLLTTTGRKSGQRRTTPLFYLTDGDRLAIIASNGGNPRPPAWWLNLQAQPEAEVELRRERRQVRGERATSDEEDRLWSRFVEGYPTYQEYRQRTTREIPIVILRSAAASGDA